VLNRRVGRLPLFEQPADYAAVEKILAEAHDRTRMRIAAYCLVPNHWHLLLWPRRDGKLSEVLRCITVTQPGQDSLFDVTRIGIEPSLCPAPRTGIWQSLRECGVSPPTPATPLVERRQALYIGRVDGGPLNRLWCIGREGPASWRARVKAFRSDMSIDLSCSQGKR
jgi:hypothetical protein